MSSLWLQVDFQNFVEENLELSPAELGLKDTRWERRQEQLEREEDGELSAVAREGDEKKGAQRVGYELDELLSGIIPNASDDEEAADETDAYMRDLLDEGPLLPATVQRSEWPFTPFNSEAAQMFGAIL